MDSIIKLVEAIRIQFGGRDIFETAENSGATVWFRDLGSLKGFYICERKKRYIIVNNSLNQLYKRTV